MRHDEQMHTMRWVLFWIFVGLFVVIVIATLAVVFANVGSPTEDERALLFKLFVLEIGVAIATLFYSVFRLKRDDALATTKRSARPNHLDREGFKHVLDLHFQSVLSSVLELFDDLQLQHQVNPAAVDRGLAALNVRRVVKEARDKLSVFSVDGIEDISGFLASNFPQDRLDEAVNHVLSIAFARGEAREQRKRVSQIVRNIQVELLEQVQEKLARRP